MAWWIQADYSVTPTTYKAVNSVDAPVNSYTVIPYPNQSAAVSEAATLTNNAIQGVAGSLASGAKAAAADAIPEPVTSFLHRLTESNTWIRVVEVLFGGVLVTVAVTHMLKPPVQGAVKAGGDFSSLIKLVAK
jgi:hypothetical protein